MPITPKSYSVTASVTIDGTDVTTTPVTIMTGSTHGSLIRTLELSNTGDYDAVAHIRRLNTESVVYADIKVDLEPKKPIVLWDEFVILPAGHVLQLEADSDDIQATVSCHEGFPEPPVRTQGYLRVTLSGTEAGQWSVDAGTTWHDSAATVMLDEGDYTVTFKAVSGLFVPSSRSVSIYEGALAQIAATYTTFYARYTVHDYNLTPLFDAADLSSMRLTLSLSVIDGALYLGTGTTLLDAGPGWTGCGDWFLTGPSVISFAIKDGDLYKVTQPPSAAVTLLDDTLTWTAVYSGTGTYTFSGNTYQTYAFGLTSTGQLHWLEASGTTLAKTGVASLKGALAITSDGKLWYINSRNKTVAQLGSATDWAGLLSPIYAYNTSGELYYTSSALPPVKMGTGTAWATGMVHGHCGIDGDGKLYRLVYSSGTTPQIGSATDWVDANSLSSTHGYVVALNSAGGLYIYSASDGTLIAQAEASIVWTAHLEDSRAIDEDGKAYTINLGTGVATQEGTGTSWSASTAAPYDFRLAVYDNL